jgi:hypothetical protein
VTVRDTSGDEDFYNFRNVAHLGRCLTKICGLCNHFNLKTIICKKMEMEYLPNFKIPNFHCVVCDCWKIYNCSEERYIKKQRFMGGGAGGGNRIETENSWASNFFEVY